MNGIRNFHVRKYSFHKDGQWQHFPARNDISLTVINRATVKVIWKSTVMEEIQIHTNNVEAHSKSPAIGFKYYALGDVVHRRFQVSFISPQEHQQCVLYLCNECDLPVPVSGSSSTTMMTQLQATQIANFPDSQFIVPMTPQPQPMSLSMAPPQQPLYQQQDYQHRSYTHAPVQSFFPSQPTLSQPALSQPQVSLPQLSMTQYTQPETHIDYLSQILDPERDSDVCESSSREMSLDQLDKMSDDEIKVLLKEKIKDVGFINFVERLESCLKGMQ